MTYQMRTLTSFFVQSLLKCPSLFRHQQTPLDPFVMMDYSKLKVAELKDLLTSRSLPVSGKKEELVARLVESDKGQPVVDDLGDLAPPEEEYDWDAPATKTYCSG